MSVGFGMQVLLVAARRSRYTGESISAPFQGLLSIAASVREGTFADTRGITVSVVDEQLDLLKRSPDGAGNWLDKLNADVIGVQVCTSSLKNGVDVLRQARERWPHVLTVLGGTGVASASVAEALVRDASTDVVVHGEGEATFAELVEAYGAFGRNGIGRVAGLSYRRDDGFVSCTGKRPAITPLDCLPFPARDLVDMAAYRRISRGRAGNLLTSRGCSYACAYCYSKHQWGVGQRRFSVKRTVDEVRILVDEYGLDRIRIEDDDFLEDKSWSASFCAALIESGLSGRMEWEAKARPDHIDPDTLHLLRRAGCFRLLVGVETLDPVLLSRMARPLQVAVVERALDQMHQHGIGVQATLILGIPGESDRAMRHTLEWLDNSLHHDHDISSPCFFVPFYAEIATAMSRRLPFTVEVDDTDCYTGHIPVASSAACSLHELRALYDDMQASRRGIYERIAHLAQEDEVFHRMGSVW
jgi:radical SAM superfamily enzyme YgiQ (UPF0313 family)